MKIDVDYITEQLKYSVENAISEGAKVDPFDTFEVYANDENKEEEMITVMVSDFLRKKDLE